MKKCTNCGKELSDDAKFCIYCGAVQNEDKADGLQQTSEEASAPFGLQTAENVAESTMVGEPQGFTGAGAGESAGAYAEADGGEEAPQTWGEVGFEGAPADTQYTGAAQDEGQPQQPAAGYQSAPNEYNTYNTYT